MNETRTLRAVPQPVKKDPKATKVTVGQTEYTIVSAWRKGRWEHSWYIEVMDQLGRPQLRGINPPALNLITEALVGAHQ